MKLKLNNSYLKTYLAMVENTESPRLYHVWSALFGVSAALGRRTWLPFGSSQIYPNMYVFLVGNPATRKSTAMKEVKRQLKASTGIRFAPGDTGGARQGLVLAMEGKKDEEAEIQAAIDAAGGLSLDALAGVSLETSFDKVASIDRHVLAVTHSEISQFLGAKSSQMTDFLTLMWDGEDEYDYKTSGGSNIHLDHPMLNILGCATPATLVESLPAQSGARGFLSRVILVYGEKKHKRIPRPIGMPEELIADVREKYSKIFYDMSGPFTESEEALDYSVTLYDRPLGINDSRFIYYAERRYTHFLKLGMVLAAARGSMVIEKDDYVEADYILKLTELGMPNALGEFGMSPIAAAKQTIVEFIRNCEEPVTPGILRAVMHRDLKVNELTQCINDLVASNQIVQAQSEEHGLILLPKFTESNETLEAMNLLKVQS